MREGPGIGEPNIGESRIEGSIFDGEQQVRPILRPVSRGGRKMKQIGLYRVWRLHQEAEVRCRANNWKGWEWRRKRDIINQESPSERVQSGKARGLGVEADSELMGIRRNLGRDA